MAWIHNSCGGLLQEIETYHYVDGKRIRFQCSNCHTINLTEDQVHERKDICFICKEEVGVSRIEIDGKIQHTHCIAYPENNVIEKQTDGDKIRYNYTCHRCNYRGAVWKMI